MRTAIMILTCTASVLVAAPVPAGPTDAELKEKALKLNKDASDESSANAKLKELNKDKANTPRLVRVAEKVVKDAKSGEKPFRFYAALVLAKAASYAKEHDAAETFYQYSTDNAIRDLKSGKYIVLAGVSQIDYYLSRKQYAKAIRTCERLLDEDYDDVKNQAIFILEKKLRAMARDGSGDAALDELANLMKRSRNPSVLLMSLKGGIQREAGKFSDAVDTYKDALEKLQADENIPEEAKKIFGSSLRYSLSGVYTEMNKVDDAVGELEKLMEMNPENPTFKNDLGFVLADNDRNLDRAEKLVREAVKMDLELNKKAAEEGKLDPELAKKANPAYVDSLGWVLYKQKKYDEAIKHLLESAGADDEEGDHIEIWDHVGDCYLALGKKKEALESFQRALRSDDVTKKDAERRRKVTEKMNKLKRELK